MNNEPTFPGSVIEARPLGIFKMLDRDLPDDKILAVPASDPLSNDYQSIDDIPKHFLREAAHFFEVYKDLEGIRTKPIGWEGLDAAHVQIEHAVSLYLEKFGRGRRI
jgi:inorganic pyrophosphatase